MDQFRRYSAAGRKPGHLCAAVQRQCMLAAMTERQVSPSQHGRHPVGGSAWTSVAVTPPPDKNPGHLQMSSGRLGMDQLCRYAAAERKPWTPPGGKDAGESMVQGAS